MDMEDYKRHVEYKFSKPKSSKICHMCLSKTYTCCNKCKEDGKRGFLCTENKKVKYNKADKKMYFIHYHSPACFSLGRRDSNYVMIEKNQALWAELDEETIRSINHWTCSSQLIIAISVESSLILFTVATVIAI